MIAGIGFLITCYVTVCVIGYLWIWLRNGCNFRATRDDLRFHDEMRLEQKEQKMREYQKTREEYPAKRKERLGY